MLVNNLVDTIQNPCCDTLNISGRGELINEEFLAQLISLLEKNKHVKTLILADNNLNDNHARMLARLNTTGIIELILGQNSITQQGATYLAQIISLKALL